jgi:hypothetical protein
MDITRMSELALDTTVMLLAVTTKNLDKLLISYVLKVQVKGNLQRENYRLQLSYPVLDLRFKTMKRDKKNKYTSE